MLSIPWVLLSCLENKYVKPVELLWIEKGYFEGSQNMEWIPLSVFQENKYP